MLRSRQTYRHQGALAFLALKKLERCSVLLLSDSFVVAAFAAPISE
jgi:hypothetical protein